MYICVYVCMCVCVYACMCASMCACVHVCALHCACVHVCMCACVHVCMCACVHVCMCACVHVCMCACVHVCMCACVHVCMCACVHVCMCACVHVCMCACVHVCMCACVHVCMCACVHVCMCACVLVCMCACVHVCMCGYVWICVCACVRVCAYVCEFVLMLLMLKPLQTSLTKVTGIEIPMDALLFSMDVESLYTNIDNNSGIEAVTQAFLPNPDFDRPDVDILEVLKISFQHNDFLFASNWYLKLFGTAMGKRFASNYANLFMAEWEKQALRKCNKYNNKKLTKRNCLFWDSLRILVGYRET